MSLAECCTQGFKHNGKTTGSLATVGGLESYVVGAANGTDKVVVIFTDIFGHKFLNTQLLAEQFAEALKAQVVIPDILENDPLPGDGSVALNDWLPNHSKEKTTAIVDGFLHKFKQEASPKEIYGV